MAEFKPIDFADLARALLDRAETLVPQWLPGGSRKGAEWVCGDLGGGAGGSCSVNLVSGVWADFSGEDRGGDLISLYAAINNLNQGQAARQLMGELGWQQPQPAARGSSTKHSGAALPVSESRPEPPLEAYDEATAGPSPTATRRSLWRAIVPVPRHAPAADFKHWHYTQVAGSWEYRFEGALYGHVVRFATSDGGKEILPHTWCVDESDARGTQRWHWKQWDVPRPLYVPATLLSGTPADVPVVLVEGEKCALAGHVLLGHEFDFVSWPGGSNAWAKAAWGWLMGRTVYLWPDADAKRQRLTPQERRDGVDPDSKPLLAEERQPGMKAMVAIGSVLVADQGCTVLMCPVPKPEHVVSDGWDIADAIAGGWTAEDVRAFIRGAHVFVPPDDAARARASVEGMPTPSRAGAGTEMWVDADAWRGALLTTEKGAIKAVRENIVLALDGLPAKGLPGVQEAQGVVAWNEFTNDVVKLKPSPWGTPAGVWSEVDDLLMGEWLVREHWLPSVARQTLEEATRMVACRHTFHPVRQYLQALEWDGTPRLRTWLRRACLEPDEWDDEHPLQRYLARAGTYYLMGMCQRVLLPGCKFDYMLVLESPQQGRGKSSRFRVLGGDYFADTGVVLGDKDSYQQLQGRWMYEMGELDAMGKAEITKVKLYIASQSDYFRASFDRRARDYPRQVVFGGTTNDDQYLIDSSGNRRFWPVRVTRQVDLDWVRENRDQLFAEAVARLAAGKRWYPLPDEEKALFVPQQEARRAIGAIEAAITAYLYDETQKVSMSGENGALVNEISANELLLRIGFTLDKQTDIVHRRATAALRRLEWEHRKSSKAGRPWVYRRPKGDAMRKHLAGASDGSADGDNDNDHQPGHDAGPQPAGAGDDCPF